MYLIDFFSLSSSILHKPTSYITIYQIHYSANAPQLLTDQKTNSTVLTVNTKLGTNYNRENNDAL